MAIPTNFSSGNLSGFYLSSVKLVAVEHHYRNFKPCTGGHFVRIDDPDAIDSDGSRLPEARNAAISLVNETTWLPRMHKDDTLTHGGKGAWLECRNVQIPMGKCLWFRYAFLRFASLPANAFATLLFFPHDETSAAPLLPLHWFCSAKDLQQKMDNINQTGWTEQLVKVDRDNTFHGTVRWIVSTGHNVVDQSAIPDNTRFVRPGCLLIDAIDIR